MLVQAKHCTQEWSWHQTLHDVAAVVMEDMLWAFMGFEGKYIRIHRNHSLKHGLSYFLEGRVEHALHELVTRMLPIWYARHSPHVTFVV